MSLKQCGDTASRAPELEHALAQLTKDPMRRDEWLVSLGNALPCCLAVAINGPGVLAHLRTCPPEKLALLMTQEERETLARLSAEFMVYRERDTTELLWTLNPALLNEAKQQVVAKVERDRVVYKQGCEKCEILAVAYELVETKTGRSA